VTLELAITFAYWLFVLPFHSNHSGISQFEWARKCLDNSLPTILLLIDFSMNEILFNIKHIVFSLLLVTLYLLTNMSIVLCNGTPIYSMLTWGDVYTVFIVIGSFVFVVAAFLILTYISNLKHKKHQNRVQTMRMSIREERYKRSVK
jgi:uncharacterized membrane protein